MNTGWGVGSNATGGGEESTETSTASTADVTVPADSTNRGGGWGIGSN
ncbi:MAG TPA: hypothetical protein VFR81_09665 [Longimicrobium sp.]|nr:hypothetical protein [Longimicrobium sp.]